MVAGSPIQTLAPAAEGIGFASILIKVEVEALQLYPFTAVKVYVPVFAIDAELIEVV
jgi:hypothetical protein